LLSIDRAGQIVSIKAGDAEVAAQVEQVNGAQVAGDGDQSEAPWGLREDNRAAQVCAIHHHPHIGGIVMHGATGVGGGDDVLPAAQMIGLAHGFNLRPVHSAIRGEAEDVDAEAVELVDRLLNVGVGVGHGAGCGVEHVAVKAEAGLRCGLRLQFSERRGHPVENDRAGVVLRVHGGWSVGGGRVGRVLGTQRDAGDCSKEGEAWGKTQEELHGY